MSITDKLVEELRKQARKIDGDPYGRVAIEWQDSKPVMVEVTTKHKPGNNWPDKQEVRYEQSRPKAITSACAARMASAGSSPVAGIRRCDGCEVGKA